MKKNKSFRIGLSIPVAVGLMMAFAAQADEGGAAVHFNKAASNCLETHWDQDEDSQICRMMILMNGSPDFNRQDFGQVSSTLTIGTKSLIVTSVTVGQLKALKADADIIDFAPDFAFAPAHPGGPQ
jgi:hypothetical protein